MNAIKIIVPRTMTDAEVDSIRESVEAGWRLGNKAGQVDMRERFTAHLAVLAAAAVARERAQGPTADAAALDALRISMAEGLAALRVSMEAPRVKTVVRDGRGQIVAIKEDAESPA